MAIDWLVASGANSSTPAPAALPEAATRAKRAGGLRSDEVLSVGHPLTLRNALSLRVVDGAAWNGYIGISLHVARSARTATQMPDLSAYVALVEKVPACEEGTLVERRLVRSLIGPLTLATLTTTQPVEHRLATRLPDMRQPERLTAVAWVENTRGQIVAAGTSPGEQCAAPLLVSKQPPVPCDQSPAR